MTPSISAGGGEFGGLNVSDDLICLGSVEGWFGAFEELSATQVFCKHYNINSTSSASYGGGIKFRNEGHAHYTFGQKGSVMVLADTGANGETLWTNPHDLMQINLSGEGRFKGDVVAFGIPTAVYSNTITTLEEPVITDSPTALDILIEKNNQLTKQVEFLMSEIQLLKQNLK
ncbi:MAG: hypothetical protein ACRCX4_06975 [Bacteroidales bacterium]